MLLGLSTRTDPDMPGAVLCSIVVDLPAFALHLAEARGVWTSKQDLIQVFGLRKVYKLSGGRKWWQVWRRCPQPKQQQEKKQYVAVADSWFGVPKGQLLCLLGPNGAGKTTSINCLIGERRMSMEVYYCIWEAAATFGVRLTGCTVPNMFGKHKKLRPC